MFHALREVRDYTWRNLSRDESLGDHLKSEKLPNDRETQVIQLCVNVRKLYIDIRFSIVMCQYIAEFQSSWTESTSEHVLSYDFSMYN